MHSPTPRGQRAISKEGMAALAFALTVSMMGVTGGLLIQSTGGFSDGGPILTAEAEPIDPKNGPGGQWIRLYHDSGEVVDVGNLTLNVSIRARGKQASLHGLPTDSLRQSDYEGNHLFTIGPDGVADAATANSTDGVWTSGESISVRIEPRRTDLRDGDSVRVAIIHEPTKKRLFEERIDVVSDG